MNINTIINTIRTTISGPVMRTNIANALEAIQDAIDGIGTSISNVYTKSEIDSDLALKADAADVYTKAEVDAEVSDLEDTIALKANSADVYTKAQVDTALSNVTVETDAALSSSSTNPVQNKVVKAAFDDVNSSLSAVVSGNKTLSKATILASTKYTTGSAYVVGSSHVGTNISQRTLTESALWDTYRIDISGYASIKYPVFRSTRGFGQYMLSSDGTIVYAHYDSTEVHGTVIEATIPSNAVYLMLPVYSSSAESLDFDIKLYGYNKSNDMLLSEITDLNTDVEGHATSINTLNNKMTLLEASSQKAGNFDAEIVGFICYGQSWSMGYDTQATTTTQKYDNIMLNTGVMNSPASVLEITATSFSPLIEQTVYSSANYNQRCGESPCSAQTDIVKQLIEMEYGYDETDIAYQLFSAAPGMGSKTIEQLSRGTDFYTRFMAVVQKANDLARAQNKGFVLAAFSWAQGKSSEDDEHYYDLLEALRADIDTDVKAITGQTQDVKCIAWQAITGGSTSPERYYSRYVYASEKYANIICSGTHYYMSHVADNNLHMTALSQDLLGAQFGVAYMRTIVDGEKFVPLKPTSARVFGNIMYIDFHVPEGNLVFDTTTVAEATNYGFQIFDDSDVEKTISDVEIVTPKTVKIVCSENIVSTDHIVYGNVGGTAYNPQTGKRGNLRDTQGERIVYTTTGGTELPCHNWAVIFDKTVTELTS